MHNVLEKLRHGEALNAKEKATHEQGLVSVLRELHDRPGATLPLADKAPEQAAAEEELLSRLVALNAERAAEEARGHIRWLRPEFQNPGAATAPGHRHGPRRAGFNPPTHAAHAGERRHDGRRWRAEARPTGRCRRRRGRGARPARRRQGGENPLAQNPARTSSSPARPARRRPAPITAEALARRYTGARATRVAEVLDTLVALGQARRDGETGYAA